MGVAVRQWALVVLVCLGFNGTAMLIATPVHAALIPIDDIIGVFGTPGSGAVTLDTDTNLEWLDLIFSLNRSYNDVSNEFGLGRDFEGWRHATMPEVTTLFSHP